MLTPPEALTPISEVVEKEDDSNSLDDKKTSQEGKSIPAPSLRESGSESNNNNAPTPFDSESIPDPQLVQDTAIITQEFIEEEQLAPDEIPLPTEGYTPDIRLTPAEFTSAGPTSPKSLF